MDKKFEVSGREYRTDAETLAQLRQYRDNEEMFSVVMHLGLAAGRIIAR